MSSSQTSLSSSDAGVVPVKPTVEPTPQFGPMHDVQCGVEFIVGTGHITVRECLELDAQSIVRLDQSGGADLELRVHGVPLAVGEVVIMDDMTALRLTRIASPVGTEAA